MEELMTKPDESDSILVPALLAAGGGASLPVPAHRAVPPRAPQRPAGPRDATFHAAFVRQIVGRLQRDGRDIGWVLGAGEVTPDVLDRSERLLPFESVRRVIHAAQFASARPTLALELAREMNPSAMGCFGYALNTATTIGRAMQVLERFSGLRNRAIRLSVHTPPGVLRLQCEPAFDLGDVRRFVLDHCIVTTLQLLRVLAARPMPGIVVHVPGEAPAWRAAWDALDVTVRFDAPSYALDLPAMAADLPTVGGSAAEFASAWRECEATERRQRQSQTFTARIGELLDVEGAIDLEAAASRLAMSTRTLIRRLRAEDTTFQALREGYRREQALQLLQDRGLSVADIATRLGYVDGSNFSRTFRRWFGATPIDVRLGRVPWPENPIA